MAMKHGKKKGDWRRRRRIQRKEEKEGGNNFITKTKIKMKGN